MNFLATAQLSQSSWGPDAFGYTANTTAYQWVEINNRPGTITVTAMGDDDSKGPFQIGFPFHYYWSDYQEVRIGSNGWVSFSNVSNIASCFPTIPQQGGVADNFLAPFMVDLNPAGIPPTGTIRYWSNFFDSFVITYQNIPFWTNNSAGQIGSNTFQVVLNGADSSIRFQYNTMSNNFYQGCASDLVIGFENVTGALGLQMGVEQVPTNNTAIRIQRPASTSFTVPDATIQWALNTQSGGQFFPANQLPFPQANVKNVGNTSITNNISVVGTLRNASNAIVWTETSSLPGGLLAGFDQTIFFSTQPNVSTPGIYRLEVALTNSQDINPSNNSRVVEVVLLSATADSVLLSYASQGMPTANQSWSGGDQDDGMGIYIEPPYYPAYLRSAQLYIRGTSAADTFWVKVYNDSGTPGTVIDSVVVLPFTYTPESWVTVPLNGFPITFGGFYVAWFQGGAIAQLGSETSLPISRRSYEILSGSWSEFRENTTKDLLINVFVANQPPVAGFNSKGFTHEINAFPNPAKDWIRIHHSGGIPETYRWISITGAEVMQQKHSLNTEAEFSDLDISSLTPGVYFLELIHQKGVDRIRVIKE